MINNLFWDFDGVLLDSESVKRKAFARIFDGYDPALVAQLVAYHVANGGLSRYHKIRYFHEVLLRQPITESQVNALAGRFSDLVKDELAQPHHLIAPSVEFVRRHHRDLRFHVVSGADEVELQYLCRVLGLTSYFLSIHGSPTPKLDNVRQLLISTGYDRDRTAMIGDSINDLDASVASGIRFFAFNNEGLRGHRDATYVDSLADGSFMTMLQT